MLPPEELETIEMGLALCRLIADEPEAPVAVGDTLTIEARDFDAGRALILRDSRHPVEWLPDLAVAGAAGMSALHQPVTDALHAATRALTETMDQPVWIAGHGLAGAFAAFEALKLAQSGEQVTLCTFGQPRVLKNEAHLPDGLIWHRFVTAGDVIATLPATFLHPQPPILTSDELGEDPPDLAALIQRIDKVRKAHREKGDDGVSSVAQSVEGLEPSLAEHRIDEYLSDMSRISRRQERLFATAIEMEEEAAPPVAAAPPQAPDAVARSSPPIDFLEGDAPPAERDGPVTRARRAADGGVRRLARGTIRVLTDMLSPMMSGAVASAPPEMSGADEEAEAETELEAAPPTPAETAADSGSGTPSLPVLIALNRDDWSPPDWVEVLSGVEEFRVARVPEDRLKDLRADPGVFNVELSRVAGALELNRSVPMVGGDTVHRPDLDERGDRAVIGIVDTGIDILHNAFGDGQGGSRILAVWHQGGRAGPTPHGVDATFDADFGTLYTAARIVELRAGPKDDIPPILRDSRMPDESDNGHGTHVASIAAGRAFDAVGEGMAPEAGIIVVVPHIRVGPGDPPSIGYSASHVSALAFLRKVSGGGNAILNEPRPIAVNISMGMNAGAHDGMTPLETAIDVMTNKGKMPGFAIVKSAGNEGTTSRHARVALANLGKTVSWKVDDNSGSSLLYLEAWYSHRHDVHFRLIGPENSGELKCEGEGLSMGRVGNAICRMELSHYSDENADSQLTIEIRHDQVPIKAGTWTLAINSVALGGANRDFDIWFENDAPNSVTFVEPDPKITLTVPGTADSVITVAACTKDDMPILADTSSAGPTRTGKVVKPDISAPGRSIVAARAGTDDPNASMPRSGTSMAAPHVTGAAALVMSALAKQGKGISANSLRAKMSDTVHNSDGVHDTRAGYGVLDAEAFIRKALT